VQGKKRQHSPSVGDAIAVFFAASKGALARPSLPTDRGGWKGKFDSR
jgi:hypothetical protein